MAIIYQADISPTKLELIGGWLPSQGWHPGGSDSRLRAVGAYRFDDPDGEVGIETHLVKSGDGPLLQVPLTYRGAELPGGQSRLLGIMDHSVLGRRWIYDGCGDPVYAAALAGTILGNRAQAEELIVVDGGHERHHPSVRVTGSSGETATHGTAPSSGTDTMIELDGLEMSVRRVVDLARDGSDLLTLTGTWAGQDAPVVLATARRT